MRTGTSPTTTCPPPGSLSCCPSALWSSAACCPRRRVPSRARHRRFRSADRTWRAASTCIRLQSRASARLRSAWSRQARSSRSQSLASSSASTNLESTRSATRPRSPTARSCPATGRRASRSGRPSRWSPPPPPAAPRSPHASPHASPLDLRPGFQIGEAVQAQLVCNRCLPTTHSLCATAAYPQHTAVARPSAM